MGPTGYFSSMDLSRDGLRSCFPRNLWLVSKTVSDKLRAHLLAQGIEGIPANNTAVFNVLQDHGMLQPTTDGKAIWRATITSDIGWSHTFTLLRLAPALIWEGDDRPEPFTGTVVIEVERNDATTESSIDSGETSPVATTARAPSAAPAADSVDALLALLGTSDTEPHPQRPEVEPPPATGINDPAAPSQANDSMLAPAAVLPSTENSGNTREQPSGEHFMAWLRNRVQSRKLIINDAKALVHTVADTAFLVSPGVFQRYAQEHPHTDALAKQDQTSGWQWVQKRFEKLQLHRKQDNGLNLWACEVSGPRRSRRLHGYLLAEPQHLFDEVPPNNPFLQLGVNLS